MGANGYIAAGYYGETQYPHASYHLQHHQQHQQQQQQHGYDDYTHYPHPEEYINDRNRAYFNAHNGDRYAVPSKPRQRLESDCKSHCSHFSRLLTIFSFSDSPYGDVSGLPDPYTGHDISDELQRQLTFDGTSNTGISLQSHDNQEGYSTPNRRVIREIIV